MTAPGRSGSALVIGEALAQRCQTWLDEARSRLAAVAQEDSAD